MDERKLRMAETEQKGSPKRGKFAGRVKSRWRRSSRITQWVIIVIVVILVAVRIAMPYFVKDYVNRQLRHLPDYSGSVKSIDISLWRGAYRINELKIQKTGGDVPVPFISAPAIDIALQWHALLHGKIAGKIRIDHPDFNFVAGPTEKQSQLGTNQPWEETVKSFYPFDINQFEIREGNVRFQNFFKSEKVNIYMTNLRLIATNLTNTRNKGQKLPAGINAKAITLGGGQLTVAVKLNPLAAGPTYEMNVALTNVDVVALNPFLRSYAKVDVKSGNFSMYTTVASADGKYDGSIKVLFQNLDVFAWSKEKEKNVLEIFWQAIVGTLVVGFKNHPHDQLATQIPISGTYTNGHVGVMPAIGNLLKNGFVRALMPNIESPKKLEDVKKKDEKKETLRKNDTGISSTNDNLKAH